MFNVSTIMRLFKLSLCLFIAFLSLKSFASVESYFQKIQTSPTELYAFLKKMPKGGELHYHLAGGFYPETLLTLAAKKSYCLDTKTFTMTPDGSHCDGILSKDVLLNPNMYQATIRAWSMKDFIPLTESGHDHFFNSFFKFMPSFIEFQSELLAQVIGHAASQNEHYLEIMIMPDNGASLALGKKLTPLQLNDNQTYQNMIKKPEFQNTLALATQNTKNLINNARKIMHCDTDPNQPRCKVTIKFLAYILREQPDNTFFGEAALTFALANQMPDIVGVNIVQAEDGPLALKNYKTQMHMIKFLHQKYPNVLISLHAGELEFGTVHPDDLRFHIHDAVFTGNAQRIGHGSDIAYEDNAVDLANHMAKYNIAAELNLTSNDTILHLKGAKHPLHFYLNHHVPVILSTDDEGILRTDLTREYVRAVTEQHLSYQTLKNITRNILTYSFLKGKSIWVNAETALPIDACKILDSDSCATFLKDNPKGQEQVRLEKDLMAFEALYQ